MSLPFCQRCLQWCKSPVTPSDTLTASKHSPDPKHSSYKSTSTEKRWDLEIGEACNYRSSPPRIFWRIRHSCHLGSKGFSFVDVAFFTIFSLNPSQSNLATTSCNFGKGCDAKKVTAWWREVSGTLKKEMSRDIFRCSLKSIFIRVSKMSRQKSGSWGGKGAKKILQNTENFESSPRLLTMAMSFSILSGSMPWKTRLFFCWWLSKLPENTSYQVHMYCLYTGVGVLAVSKLPVYLVRLNQFGPWVICLGHSLSRTMWVITFWSCQKVVTANLVK